MIYCFRKCIILPLFRLKTQDAADESRSEMALKTVPMTEPLNIVYLQAQNSPKLILRPSLFCDFGIVTADLI